MRAIPSGSFDGTAQEPQKRGELHELLGPLFRSDFLIMGHKREEQAAWKELEQVAHATTAEGFRALVVAVGAGFNTQAYASKRLEWHDLLLAVRDRLDVSVEVPDRDALHGNATLVWEAILTKLALRKNKSASGVERKLQRAVAAVVRDFYGPGSALAQAFASLRFRDVLSYNFDLGFHTRAPSFRVDQRFSAVSTHLVEPTSETRVWYPHGCALDPRSLQLGIRRYGVLLRSLENARIRFTQEQRLLDNALTLQAESSDSRAERRRKISDLHRANGAPFSWLVPALSAPLLFVGMGLGNEEWDLWWLINQRLRNVTRDQHHLQSFVFTHRSDAERLRTAARLSELKLLPFDDYHDGWSQLGDCLGTDLLGASKEPR